MAAVSPIETIIGNQTTKIAECSSSFSFGRKRVLSVDTDLGAARTFHENVY